MEKKHRESGVRVPFLFLHWPSFFLLFLCALCELCGISLSAEPSVVVSGQRLDPFLPISGDTLNEKRDVQEQ